MIQTIQTSKFQEDKIQVIVQPLEVSRFCHCEKLSDFYNGDEAISRAGLLRLKQKATLAMTLIERLPQAELLPKMCIVKFGRGFTALCMLSPVGQDKAEDY